MFQYSADFSKYLKVSNKLSKSIKTYIFASDSNFQYFTYTIF